jgi:hypothetical protein
LENKKEEKVYFGFCEKNLENFVPNLKKIPSAFKKNVLNSLYVPSLIVLCQKQITIMKKVWIW